MPFEARGRDFRRNGALVNAAVSSFEKNLRLAARRWA